MMERTSIERINGIKSFLKLSNIQQDRSIEQRRKDLLESVSRIPKICDVSVEKTDIEHFSGEWIRTSNCEANNKKVILYFHGGGFISGSCDTYRDLASRISKASAVQVLTINYRLAPEYRYPAANDDCLAAYKWLLKNGFSAENIILGGDSIGATLVLMTLLSLHEDNIQLPKAVFLLSPHADLLNLEGESYSSKREVDPMETIESINQIMAYYLGSIKEKPLILSPLRYDFKGFPSMFIQAGSDEIILSDSFRLSQHAKESEIDVTLEVWDGMWHVFQSMAFMLPEGQQAINNIGQFIKRCFH